MSSSSHVAAKLPGLQQAHAYLQAQPGRRFLASQISRAVALAAALNLDRGMQVLVVNPPLGNPWHMLAMRACGAELTLLCENAKLLARIRAEHADLENQYAFIPGFADLLASTRRAAGLKYRVGQVSLFFPEEDSFDCICLLAISQGMWGFGADSMIQNSLRGLRDGGVLFAGFLDVRLSNAETLQKLAAEGGFDLDFLDVQRIAYDEYAPDGLLFALSDKSSRSIALDVIEQIAEGFSAQGSHDQSNQVRKALDLVRNLGIGKGARILVIGPTADLWAERVMAGVAGSIDIVLACEGDPEVSKDPDVIKARFAMFPGIAALQGGLQLQTALRNPNNRIHELEELPRLGDWGPFDLICLASFDGNLDALLPCLDGIKPGGRFLIRSPSTEPLDLEPIVAAARKSGSHLEPRKTVEYGPHRGALFVCARV
jgi:SAM-dependent methyltransferase